jgi:hypothetical protein
VVPQNDGTPGYGYVWFHGRRQRAHRVAFELATGTPAPPKNSGMVIMHRCDRPLCVNPKHLRLGTLAENALDMANKGRASAGGFNTQLDEEMIRNIRKLVAAGFKQSALAERLGMTRAAISNMVTGKTWQHVE